MADAAPPAPGDPRSVVLLDAAHRMSTTWRRSPPELVTRFDAALPLDPACQRRQMFGCPAAFANGNLFACLFEGHVVVRLDAPRRAVLQRAGGVPFQPMGRVMREYLLLPDSAVMNRRRLENWIAKAFAYASALPAKPTGGGRRRAPARRP